MIFTAVNYGPGKNRSRVQASHRAPLQNGWLALRTETCHANGMAGANSQRLGPRHAVCSGLMVSSKASPLCLRHERGTCLARTGRKIELCIIMISNNCGYNFPPHLRHVGLRFSIALRSRGGLPHRFRLICPIPQGCTRIRGFRKPRVLVRPCGIWHARPVWPVWHVWHIRSRRPGF